MGPLAGIKVLDLSRILAGPWATQLLADFGAIVWKVEKPGNGDDTRQWGPPWIKDRKGRPTKDSAYFASTNRGKLSLAIDFTKPAGQQIIARWRCAPTSSSRISRSARSRSTASVTNR
jgi:crotonobetainyl-CoA:carnitine CoA-transferase CaiB-like acyl-CoA transferase